MAPNNPILPDYMPKQSSTTHPASGAHGGGVRGDQCLSNSRKDHYKIADLSGARFGRMFQKDQAPPADFPIDALTKLGGLDGMSAGP